MHRHAADVVRIEILMGQDGRRQTQLLGDTRGITEIMPLLILQLRINNDQSLVGFHYRPIYLESYLESNNTGHNRVPPQRLVKMRVGCVVISALDVLEAGLLAGRILWLSI